MGAISVKEACDKVVMKEKYRRVDPALLELGMYRAKSTLTYVNSWIYGLLDSYFWNLWNEWDR